MPGTRKLGRVTASRTAMLRAMVTFLLENGKIETTVTRAKEVKAMTEKIITKAKENDLHSKRQVYSYVTKETVAKKVFDEIAPGEKWRLLPHHQDRSSPRRRSGDGDHRTDLGYLLFYVVDIPPDISI